MPYEIEFYSAAIRHLKDLPARQRTIVMSGIREQLTNEPLRETRNRKLRRPNPIAPMELRLGNLRAYYDVSDSVVTVLAIGVKIRERVLIGGEDVEEL
jgi:mRNA-degrading endonuclease RelE of RelBE toxin-antitoxin system